MVHPSGSEIARLMQLAREIRDTTDESGFAVDVAIGQHQAFSSCRRPTSELQRSLVLAAARRGASRTGLGIDEVSGSLDIIDSSSGAIRRYRVKRVTVNADGNYEAICGAGSSLLTVEHESIFPEEKWILGYALSDDHTIDQLIAAEIVGWRGSGPVRLEFGHIVDLSDTQPPHGFISTDEGLEGFDDESDRSSAEAV